MTTVAAVAGARTEARYFYVWMAGVCAIVAFGGFATTYWLQLPAGTFVGAPIVHVHALLFSAWPLLFLAQTWRAAEGRMEHHKAWGVAGASLAGAMLFVGLATAINSMHERILNGYAEGARAFLIVPVTGAVMFAILFAAALLNVSRPDWHKRLMLVASVSILQAAMARVFFLVRSGGVVAPGERPGAGAPQPVAISVGPGLVVDLIILAGIVYDWRTRGRPHPAYLIAGGAVVALQLLRVPLSTTPAWQAVAGFLDQFA